MIDGLAAGTVGGTADALHADIIEHEMLGVAEGVAGRDVHAVVAPVLRAGVAPALLEVSSDDGWTEWTQVDTSRRAAPSDHHYCSTPCTATIVVRAG